jgi:heme exporter protein D
MVSELEGGVWQAHEVDLNQVARLVGTAGTAQRQRKMHEVERQQHRRAGRKAAQIPDL